MTEKKKDTKPPEPLTDAEHHRRAEKLAKALAATVKPPAPKHRKASWNRPAA